MVFKEIFTKEIEQERIDSPSKLDLSIFKKKGKSKGFSGYLLSRMKEFLKKDPETVYSNREICWVLQEIYKKYVEFEELRSSAQVRIAKWKGKSGMKIIGVEPHKFIISRYQKKDQDSEAKEIIREISKKDVNFVIMAINSVNKAQQSTKMIETKDIAREYCLLKNLKENTHKRELFDVNGFIWDNFFSDRGTYFLLWDCLSILDYYKVIRYRGGKTQIVKKIIDIQLILK